MSERLAIRLIGAALLAGGPLAAQGPSAAALRAEARALRKEADSVARAERAHAPVLVRVAVPGGWTAEVSPALALRAPGEIGAALRRLSGEFGPALFPDSMTLRLVADTAAYRSILAQVGHGTAFDYEGRFPPPAGAIGSLVADAGAVSVVRSADTAFRAWAGTQFLAFTAADFLTRARVEVGTFPGATVVACRAGAVSGCAAALGLVPGDAGALSRGARVSLFRLAFERGAGVESLSRFYADSAAPMAERLGALAGMPPERLIAEWRRAVLTAGDTRGADVAASVLGALALVGLALAGIRRRSV
jgi:hypothetical protein